MADKLAAADVRAALTVRWPDSEYLHILEAPLDAGRQGTKADVLIVTLWKSRGYELDVVEVKVSYGDWRNEIERHHHVVDWPDDADLPSHVDRAQTYTTRAWANRVARQHGGVPRRVTVPSAAKSAEWRHHAHRFWVAAPLDLAVRIAGEAPATWGVIGVVDERSLQVLRPAAKHVPARLGWPQVIGLLRAAADSGLNALTRAEERGFQRGVVVTAPSGGAEHLDGGGSCWMLR